LDIFYRGRREGGLFYRGPSDMYIKKGDLLHNGPQIYTAREDHPQGLLNFVGIFSTKETYFIYSMININKLKYSFFKLSLLCSSYPYIFHKENFLEYSEIFNINKLLIFDDP
jgi:hypothetical protein